MWIRDGCERCGFACAEVSCDVCGEKMCCGCATMLDCAVTNSEGHTYLHLCEDFSCQLEVNEAERTLRLVVDNTKVIDYEV